MTETETEKERYANAWRDRRLRLRTGVLAGVGLVLVTAAAFFIPSEDLRVAILLSYGALLLPVGYWMFSFRCPRCQAAFSGNIWDGLFGPGYRLASKCVSCGLPVDGGPDETESR